MHGANAPLMKVSSSSLVRVVQVKVAEEVERERRVQAGQESRRHLEMKVVGLIKLFILDCKFQDFFDRTGPIILAFGLALAGWLIHGAYSSLD